MIRAFLFATATHAFAVPSFLCLSVIHLLRASSFLKPVLQLPVSHVSIAFADNNHLFW